MELNIEIGSQEANSYIDIAAADAYLAARPGFDTAAWAEQAEDRKAFELILAAKMLDSLNFRGHRAVKNQAMAFPRIFLRDGLWVEDSAGRYMPYEDWQALVDYAGLKGVGVPGIPDAVLMAQAEIAFQVIYSHLLTLEPFGAGEMDITGLGIDVISLSFGKKPQSGYDLFSKDQISAIAPVKLFLGPYLASVRGALV
jgi:hypothetical protein